MKFPILSFFTALIVSTALFAQSERVINDSEWCDERNNIRYNNTKERHCEVREITINAREQLTVDGGQNGGISVKSWDRNEIQILAKISVFARSKNNGADIAENVSIKTGSVIEADIPKLGKREGVSVSYRIYVPENIDLNLDAYNGGISIQNVEGDLRFETLNGGLRLANLKGNVRGETTNGGIKIELTGSEWYGDELNVETTNGGVVFYIPENYNAQLETGTVNGSMDLDFPVTVSGRFNRELSVSLGNGGNLVRAVSVNGGVKIKRASGNLN